MLGKLNFFHVTVGIAGVIDVKMNGCVLDKNYILRCWYCLSILTWEWDSYIVSIAKSVPKEIGTLTQSINFFSSEAALSR